VPRSPTSVPRETLVLGGVTIASLPLSRSAGHIYGSRASGRVAIPCHAQTNHEIQYTGFTGVYVPIAEWRSVIDSCLFVVCFEDAEAGGDFYRAGRDGAAQ
jgi:hypothetical protein